MIFWMKNEKKKTAVRSLVHEQQKEKRKKRLLIVLCLCAGLSILLLFIYLYFFFTIKTIECRFEQSPCTQEQTESIRFLHNQSMFQSVTYSDPYYITLITKKFPQTIVVQFKNPEIMTYLYNEENTQHVSAITKNRFLIPTEGTQTQVLLTDLRLISIKSHTQIDSNLYSTIMDLATTITDEQTKGLEKVIVRDDQTVEWYYSSKCRILTTADRIKEQMSSLQQLRESPTIELIDLEIDLRFDHPVITKKVE